MRNMILIIGLMVCAVSGASERWYEDNNRKLAGEAPFDFIERMDRLNEWEDSRRSMQVFYLRHSTYKNYLKYDSNLKQRMSSIFNSYGIKVALDDNQVVWAHSDLVNIDENFEESISALQDLSNYGFDVAYVGLQSVLDKPLVINGTEHDYPMSKRYLDVSSYFEKIRPYFPDIKIGIIDSLPARVNEETYQNNYAGLVDHLMTKGYRLDFIHLDLPMSYPREGKNGLSFPKVVNIGKYVTNSLGVSFGFLIVDEEGGKLGSNQFSKYTVEGLGEFLKNGGEADAYIMSSWYEHPEYSIPDRITQNPATGMSVFRNADQILNFYGKNNTKECFYDVRRAYQSGNHDVIYPGYTPAGTLEGIVFRTSCDYASDKKPLYNCSTDGFNTFVSAKASCEGYSPRTPSFIGYVYSSSGNGRKPIYRCRVGGDHFVTTNYDECSRYTVGGVLGYTK